jgi:hypothetical protein
MGFLSGHNLADLRRFMFDIKHNKIIGAEILLSPQIRRPSQFHSFTLSRN